MEKNMGVADRGIRVALALVGILLIGLGAVQGTLAILLGIVAAVFIITSLVGFCPLYTVLKISTRR